MRVCRRVPGVCQPEVLVSARRTFDLPPGLVLWNYDLPWLLRCTSKLEEGSICLIKRKSIDNAWKKCAKTTAKVLFTRMHFLGKRKRSSIDVATVESPATRRRRSGKEHVQGAEATRESSEKQLPRHGPNRKIHG